MAVHIDSHFKALSRCFSIDVVGRVHNLPDPPPGLRSHACNLQMLLNACDDIALNSHKIRDTLAKSRGHRAFSVLRGSYISSVLFVHCWSEHYDIVAPFLHISRGLLVYLNRKTGESFSKLHNYLDTIVSKIKTRYKPHMIESWNDSFSATNTLSFLGPPPPGCRWSESVEPFTTMLGEPIIRVSPFSASCEQLECLGGFKPQVVQVDEGIPPHKGRPTVVALVWKHPITSNIILTDSIKARI